MRAEVDRQRAAGDLLLELHRAADKSPMLLNPIQDSLDRHPLFVSEGPGACRLLRKVPHASSSMSP